MSLDDLKPRIVLLRRELSENITKLLKFYKKSLPLPGTKLPEIPAKDTRELYLDSFSIHFVDTYEVFENLLDELLIIKNMDPIVKSTEKLSKALELKIIRSEDMEKWKLMIDSRNELCHGSTSEIKIARYEKTLRQLPELLEKSMNLIRRRIRELEL